MMTERNSIYCYENSSVLKNKLNIKDTDMLKEFEKKIVSIKLAYLYKNNIGDLSLKHFLSIHKYLFEDIYFFAGEFRKENIAKDYFRFADCNYIESEIIKLFNEIENEKFFENMDREILAKKLAYIASELNVLHPFREGNRKSNKGVYKTACI